MKNHYSLILIILFSLNIYSQSQIQPGIYNTFVERLDIPGTTYTFTNETISHINLNEYKTTNIGNYYPQGETPGSAGTISLGSGGYSGYRFKLVGNNILVENQTVFDIFSNPVHQTTEQFNSSTYNPNTEVIVVEYTIDFPSSGTSRPFRSTYTLNTLGNSENNFTPFSYYPNPVKDILTISGIKSDFSYQIYNLIGQCVGTGYLKSGENQINMAYLEKSNYVLKITSGSETRILKIVRN